MTKGESIAAAEKAKKKGGDAKSEKEDKAKDDKPKDDSSPGMDRYLFVTADFNQDAIPKPVLEKLPEDKPAVVTPEKKSPETKAPETKAPQTKAPNEGPGGERPEATKAAEKGGRLKPELQQRRKRWRDESPGDEDRSEERKTGGHREEGRGRQER